MDAVEENGFLRDFGSDAVLWGPGTTQRVQDALDEPEEVLLGIFNELGPRVIETLTWALSDDGNHYDHFCSVVGYLIGTNRGTDRRRRFNALWLYMDYLYQQPNYANVGITGAFGCKDKLVWMLFLRNDDDNETDIDVVNILFHRYPRWRHIPYTSKKWTHAKTYGIHTGMLINAALRLNKRQIVFSLMQDIIRDPSPYLQPQPLVRIPRGRCVSDTFARLITLVFVKALTEKWDDVVELIVGNMLQFNVDRGGWTMRHAYRCHGDYYIRDEKCPCKIDYHTSYSLMVHAACGLDCADTFEESGVLQLCDYTRTHKYGDTALRSFLRTHELEPSDGTLQWVYVNYSYHRGLFIRDTWFLHTTFYFIMQYPELAIDFLSTPIAPVGYPYHNGVKLRVPADKPIENLDFVLLMYVNISTKENMWGELDMLVKHEKLVYVLNVLLDDTSARISTTEVALWFGHAWTLFCLDDMNLHSIDECMTQHNAEQHLTARHFWITPKSVLFYKHILPLMTADVGNKLSTEITKRMYEGFTVWCNNTSPPYPEIDIDAFIGPTGAKSAYSQ